MSTTSLAPERSEINHAGGEGARYRPRRQCHVTQVWTEDRETLPEFLKDKGVSVELWQSTHDDVVSHYKSYYNCCNAFWFNIFWFILLPILTIPIYYCYRANFESGWTAIMHKHGAEYKKNGLKMEVVMIPDKCGREKTVGLRFLNKDGYNAPPV